MSEKEINIAELGARIAVALGWTEVSQSRLDKKYQGTSPMGTFFGIKEYARDLPALVDALESLCLQLKWRAGLQLMQERWTVQIFEYGDDRSPRGVAIQCHPVCTGYDSTAVCRGKPVIHLICCSCPFEAFMSVDLFLAQTPDRCACGGMYKLAVVKVEVGE